MNKNSNTKIIQRDEEERLFSWLEEKEILTIIGPRQVGKTTLLIDRIKPALEKKQQTVYYYSFEDTDVLSAFVRHPKSFVSSKLTSGTRIVFLLDEYQYVPHGGKMLKLLYDLYTPQVKFIITGSANLRLHDISAALVGRTIFFTLYPFSFGEYLQTDSANPLHRDLIQFHQTLQHHFSAYMRDGYVDFLHELPFTEAFTASLEIYAQYGGYPGIVLSEDAKKEDRIKGIIETYIEKDIVKYLRVGDFLGFKSIARNAAGQIGNVMNYSSYQRELGISFPQIKAWFDNLDETYVTCRVLPYARNPLTELKKSPKVYCIDTGIRNGLLSDFRAMSIRQDKGAIMENIVFSQLLRRYSPDRLRYWRTKQGAEMDVIIEDGQEIIPVEVKYQNMERPSLSRSFLNFLDAYKPKKAIVMTKNILTVHAYKSLRILFFPVYGL